MLLLYMWWLCNNRISGILLICKVYLPYFAVAIGDQGVYWVPYKAKQEREKALKISVLTVYIE